SRQSCLGSSKKVPSIVAKPMTKGTAGAVPFMIALIHVRQRKLEAGGWRLEAGGWRLEAGGWRLEAGGWRLEAGGWRLDRIAPEQYRSSFFVRLSSLKRLYRLIAFRHPGSRGYLPPPGVLRRSP